MTSRSEGPVLLGTVRGSVGLVCSEYTSLTLYLISQHTRRELIPFVSLSLEATDTCTGGALVNLHGGSFQVLTESGSRFFILIC